MPIYALINSNDHQKLGELRGIAQNKSNIYFIGRKPKHPCVSLNSEHVILEKYNPNIRTSLKYLLKELYEQYGPEVYGMDPDTSLEEFIQIKMGTYESGYTDL